MLTSLPNVPCAITVMTLLLSCGGQATTPESILRDASAKDLDGSAASAAPVAEAGTEVDAPVGTRGRGIVHVYNQNDGNQGAVDAVFDTKPRLGCDVPAPLGTCVFRECPEVITPFGSSAGTLSIGSRLTSVIIEPADRGAYGMHYDAVVDPFFQVDELTISTTGRDVPAFEGKLSFPRKVTLSSDGGGGLFVVKPNVDVTFQWGDVGTDPVLVEFNTRTLDGNHYSMDCLFAGSNGQGTVPAAMLAKYKSTALTFSTNNPIELQIVAERWASAVVSNWHVQLRATGSGPRSLVTFD